MADNKIKFALYLNGWTFDGGDKVNLLQNSVKIIATEFDPSMKGSIFCPICFTPLSRKPLSGDYFSNGRKASFSHLPSYSNVECKLRTPKAEGKLYENEEEAKQAIENKELAIINGFKSDPPVMHDAQAGEYDVTAIEDEDGPVTTIPISRHNGEAFDLPSKISTVAGICKKFDENFYKYFYLPNSNVAIPLNELLHSVEDVTEEDEELKLYYGIIRDSYVGGKGGDSNIRMTRLVSNPEIHDFYLKDTNLAQRRHGIDDNSKGRIVLFWGKITTNGRGLCVEHLKWGEYGLLPEKYNSILID